jgi:hypothetical protein
MAIPALFFSGKFGKGLIGTVVIYLNRWSVRERADELDGTTAEDDGFEVIDAGVQGLTIDVDGYYFQGVSKIASHRPGRGTGLKLYTYKQSTDTGPFWDVPNFACIEFNHTSEVRGKVQFRATFRTRGTYTAPVDPA